MIKRPDELPRPLKNIPITTVEREFANALNKITGFFFKVIIKDINFETGETIIEVHVVDDGENHDVAFKL